MKPRERTLKYLCITECYAYFIFKCNSLHLHILEFQYISDDDHDNDDDNDNNTKGGYRKISSNISSRNN